MRQERVLSIRQLEQGALRVIVFTSGRFTVPPTPFLERVCQRCTSTYLQTLPCLCGGTLATGLPDIPSCGCRCIDDEHHVLFDCESTRHLRTGNVMSVLMVHSDLSIDGPSTVRDFCDSADFHTVYSYISQCMSVVNDMVLPTEQLQPSS